MANAYARLAAYSAALFLAVAPGFASAEIPTGSFEFQLGGVNSLWMGGDKDSHEDADGFCASFGAGFDAVEFCDYELSIDGRGKIGGYVEFIGRVDGTRLALEGPIKGAQRGNNRSGITRASFVIRLAGTASRNGFAWATSVSMKLVAQIDAGGVMQGTWSRKLCNEGAPCETDRWPAGPNTGSNGDWTLALDVELLTIGGGGPQFGRRAFTAGGLTGVARIRFGDDTFCDFAVSGQHDLKNDMASLTLTPTSAKCEGGSLRLRFLTKGAGGAYLAQLQYKLFGVTGTTGVHSGYVALHRNPLESFFNDPTFGWAPTSSASSSSSSSAIMAVFIISASPTSAMNSLEDSTVTAFEALQSGVHLEVRGFEARPIGPERAALEYTPAEPSDSSPPAQ